MATTPRKVHYRSGDGKPVAETPTHRDVLLGLVDLLRRHFAADPSVYVSGNMFVYYVEGDPRKAVAPDVWMARGVGDRDRDVYLVWEEARGPEMIIEVTSKKTKKEDQEKKFALYRDVLHVREYFLFDPRSEYLRPNLQGYRLVGDDYVPIEPVEGRLPSEVAGLHLEPVGRELRLYDPAAGRWVQTRDEAVAEVEALRQRAEADRQRAEAERLRAEAERQRAEAALREQARENERLQGEIEQLRRQLGGGA